MSTETLLLIVGYGIYILFFALIIKTTLKLKAEDRNRIVDLLFIGFVLYFTQMLPEEVIRNPISLSGFLIFAYGFLILLKRKFREGLR